VCTHSVASNPVFYFFYFLELFTPYYSSVWRRSLVDKKKNAQLIVKLYTYLHLYTISHADCHSSRISPDAYSSVFDKPVPLRIPILCLSFWKYLFINWLVFVFRGSRLFGIRIWKIIVIWKRKRLFASKFFLSVRKLSQSTNILGTFRSCDSTLVRIAKLNDCV